jgi:hypothetical protein
MTLIFLGRLSNFPGKHNGTHDSANTPLIIKGQGSEGTRRAPGLSTRPNCHTQLALKIKSEPFGGGEIDVRDKAARA